MHSYIYTPSSSPFCLPETRRRKGRRKKSKRKREEKN